jgi:hypothetical protein
MADTEMKGRRFWRPFFLGSAVLAATGLIAPGVAQAAMRGYIVTDFNSIKVEAPVRILLTTGGGASGMGEGDRDVLDRVDLSVSGGLLTVRMADKAGGQLANKGGKKSGQIAPTLTISTGTLRRAMVNGGGALLIRNVDGLEVDLSMNGAGEMLIEEAQVDRLNLYVSGGGRITVKGTAKMVRASANGPGTIEAAGLVAGQATIANDGVGSVRMTVNGPAKVMSTGSGDTVIGGKVVCEVTQRGVGQVICGE